MKKGIITLLLGAGLFTAQAQQQMGHKNHAQHQQQQNMSPEERAKIEAEKSASKLSLTPEQTQKWEQAARDRIVADTPLREKMKGSTTPEERKEVKQQVHQNMKTFDEKVNAFLTPEQKQKYEAEKQDRMNKMKGHHGHRGGSHVK